jgi:hypothetical protein
MNSAIINNRTAKRFPKRKCSMAQPYFMTRSFLKFLLQKKRSLALHKLFLTKLFLTKLFFFALFLFLLPSCGPVPLKTTTIGVALTDGTHTGGGLIAVDSDWLILNDPTKPLEDSTLTLIDYGMIDTITIIGEKHDRGGAVLGGLVGAIGGVFVSGALDSASPGQERSRFALGAGIGLVVGTGLGYFLGGKFADDDIILAHPDDTDYDLLNQYALYPDGLPSFVQVAVQKIEAEEEP